MNEWTNNNENIQNAKKMTKPQTELTKRLGYHCRYLQQIYFLFFIQATSYTRRHSLSIKDSPRTGNVLRFETEWHLARR